MTAPSPLVPPPGYEERLRRLVEQLRELPDLLCALSGGVDSAVLLHAAHEVLGDRAVGWIGDSASLARHELEDAREVARTIGARLVVVGTDELEVPGYRTNAGTRCYFCRRVLFEAMIDWARDHGFHHIGHGEITDDLQDVRPGRRAASELGVVAPLLQAGFSKTDVRHYARDNGLHVADKPASACLSSRIPVGTRVTRERLARIERSEGHLRELGFRILRVRDHGTTARVEFGASEKERGTRLRSSIESALASEGFEQVELATYSAPGSAPPSQESTDSPTKTVRR